MSQVQLLLGVPKICPKFLGHPNIKSRTETPRAIPRNHWSESLQKHARRAEVTPVGGTSLPHFLNCIFAVGCNTYSRRFTAKIHCDVVKGTVLLEGVPSMESNIKRLAYFFFSLGVLFAVETYYHYMILYKLWPLLIASLGGGLISIFFRRKKREPIYLASGTFFICFSVLALICNFTSWNLSQLWPLFIGFIGVSQLVLYIFYTHHKIYLFLTFLFFSVSIVMFLVFSVTYKFWWLIFILLGLTIILSESKNEKKNITDRS